MQHENATLLWIKIMAIVIVVVVGFFFIGCAGPQKIKFKSCEEKKGVETECRTFEIQGEASILPF